MKIVYLTICCLFFFIIKISGQEIITLDLHRIGSPDAKEYIISNNLRDAQSFHNYSYVCIDKKPYSLHTKSYLFRHSLEEVWNIYINGDIKHIWTGQIIQFVTSFNAKNQSFIFADDLAKFGVTLNQLIVTELHFIHQLVNIVVAHRVTAIDSDLKSIQFCYSKGGKTTGTQEITMRKVADNYTLVTHQTRYKTTNFFREKIIYPYFHTKAIDEIHRNIKSLLENP